MTVKLVQIIETDLELRGDGTHRAPYRRVTQFWGTDGLLRAEYDPEHDRDVAVSTTDRIKRRLVEKQMFDAAALVRQFEIDELDLKADRDGWATHVTLESTTPTVPQRPEVGERR